MKRYIAHYGQERGITAIEVVIGVAIAALILIFVSNTIALFINAGRTASERTKALYLVEDGLELVRFVRDERWSNISSLSTNSTHYLNVTPTTITTTVTPEYIDGYRRSFRIQNVYRNSTTDDIVASTTSGSVVDTGSKYVTMTVEWGNPTTSLSMTSILVDLTP
jgi:type II secretory pathway pseudopilin PulG